MYAGNLISAKAPQTTPLSAVEMFVLVTGIYLHNVSMQCDVTTEDGHEVKKRAKTLGAKFAVEFTATSAKQIVSESVEDLINVCLHHTSIPIERCPASLVGAGAGRKRLVAALLRFADELEEDSDRVDVAAVTQFGVTPKRSANC